MIQGDRITTQKKMNNILAENIELIYSVVADFSQMHAHKTKCYTSRLLCVQAPPTTVSVCVCVGVCVYMWLCMCECMCVCLCMRVNVSVWM